MQWSGKPSKQTALQKQLQKYNIRDFGGRAQQNSGKLFLITQNLWVKSRVKLLEIEFWSLFEMFELPYGMDFLWWLENLFPGVWRSRGWERLPSPWSWTSVPLTVFWLCSWCLTHPFFLSASRCLLPHHQSTSPQGTRPPPRWSRSSPTYNCMKGGTIQV